MSRCINMDRDRDIFSTSRVSWFITQIKTKLGEEKKKKLEKILWPSFCASKDRSSLLRHCKGNSRCRGLLGRSSGRARNTLRTQVRWGVKGGTGKHCWQRDYIWRPREGHQTTSRKTERGSARYAALCVPLSFLHPLLYCSKCMWSEGQPQTTNC